MSESFGGFYGAYFTVTIEEALRRLTREMRKARQTRRVAVLVFAHAEHKLTKDSIIPYVDYWNYRSGDALSMFFLGYQGDGADEEWAPIIDHERTFDAESLVKAVEWVENATSWRYSGQPAILICDAALERGDDGYFTALKADEVIEFDLVQAQKDLAIQSVEVFFESLIRTMKSTYVADPTWRLSDLLGSGALLSALSDAAMENLPLKGVRRVVKATDYFRVKNKTSS